LAPNPETLWGALYMTVDVSILYVSYWQMCIK
jgi:hypothetical protein